MNPIVRDRQGGIVAVRPIVEVVGKGKKEKLEDRVSEGDIFSFLGSKGYHVSPNDKIGEGHTSTVYLGRYESGSVKQNRAVKVPKEDIDSSSVCTVINLSKGDVNEKEVNAANLTSFRHDNIVSVLDSYKYNGKTIIVEEFVPGHSVEALAAITPLSEDAISKIYVPVCKAVEYLHEEGILHRDIKPSNIMVESDKYKGVTRVKLGDLQNAAKIRDIDHVVLPTRGGTSCTYPDLLNAIVQGRADRANEKTDIYAIGASIFESATGEPVLDYRLEFDENGTGVLIGDQTYKVSLMDGNRKIDHVDSVEHNQRLKARIKKLPKKLRKPVYRALSMEHRDQYWSVGGLERDLEHTGETFGKRLKERIIGAIKPALISAAIALPLAGMIWSVATNEPIPKPTMQDILRTTRAQDYSEFNFELDLKGKEGDFKSQEEARFRQDILAPYIEKVKREWPRIMDSVVHRGPFGGEYTIEGQAESIVGAMVNVHGLDTRLTSAWHKGMYLFDEEEVLDVFGKDELGRTNRLPPSYVPRRFVEVNSQPYRLPITDRIDDSPGYGFMWLKQSLIGEGNVPGTFAKYFLNDEEKGTAIIRTGSIDYFPRIVTDQDTLKGEEVRAYTIEPGYAQFIDPSKYDMINTLLAVYSMTNEEGKLDTSMVQAPEFLEGTYTRMLHLPAKQ